jgi:phospholipid transport system substrate-binding protein
MNTPWLPVPAVLLVVSFALPAPVAGGPPTDQLRSRVDRVSGVLEDPALRGDDKSLERRAAIRKIADEIFDFQETAKRSLGRHWEARTPAERQEFVQLFTDLLRRSYFSKVDRGAFHKIVFRDERLQGDEALVRTAVVLSQGSEMALDYQLHRDTGDRWKVYDLRIEGVSLVANYRAQFNKIIRTSSYEMLVTKLKSNQAEFSRPDDDPATAPRSSR